MCGVSRGFRVPAVLIGASWYNNPKNQKAFVTVESSCSET